LFDDGQRVDAVLLSQRTRPHRAAVVGERDSVYLSKGTSQMLMAGSIFAGQPNSTASATILEPRSQRASRHHRHRFAGGSFAFDSMALLMKPTANDCFIQRLANARAQTRHGSRFIQFIAKGGGCAVDGRNKLRKEAQKGRWSGTEAELEEELFKAITRFISVWRTFRHSTLPIRFFLQGNPRAGRVFVRMFTCLRPASRFGQCRIPKPVARNGIRVYYNQSFEKTWRKKNLKRFTTCFCGAHRLPTILADPDAM